ncbi:MAG: phage tail sheath family protein, partial [Bacteroidia bacterium]
MPTYNTPGVYIQEISTLPPSVAPVATAVPAFLGYTASGPQFTATRISSLLEYESIFGGPKKFALTVALASGVMTAALTASPAQVMHNLHYSLQMYFANGGGPCWIVSVGAHTATAADTDFVGGGKGLDVISKIDEPTLL